MHIKDHLSHGYLSENPGIRVLKTLRVGFYSMWTYVSDCSYMIHQLKPHPYTQRSSVGNIGIKQSLSAAAYLWNLL